MVVTDTNRALCFCVLCRICWAIVPLNRDLLFLFTEGAYSLCIRKQSVKTHLESSGVKTISKSRPKKAPAGVQINLADLRDNITKVTLIFCPADVTLLTNGWLMSNELKGISSKVPMADMVA